MVTFAIDRIMPQRTYLEDKFETEKPNSGEC